jgi:Spy/CpxP family protein refolding chaperone
MKSIKNIFTLILTLGLLFSWMEYATASELRSQKLRKAGSHRSQALRFLKKLNLTNTQRNQIRQLQAAHRKKMVEITGRIKVKKVELESEMEKPQPDQEKLDQINQEVGELVKQRTSQKIKARLELEKKILTSEQVEQLKTSQKENGAGSGKEDDTQE